MLLLVAGRQTGGVVCCKPHNSVRNDLPIAITSRTIHMVEQVIYQQLLNENRAFISFVMSILKTYVHIHKHT
jgi:hypothetical protein